ncbi:MAG: WD40-domain containing protein [candidate division WS6 bacterium 34_10]|uniref:WD40-domain containing protein n=1 Tax=candidate division WS6 bacterium 34_10 TaxID=1641389 RepID=A0A101HID4_9BACT|nr:MAG: WD40-domain containing protein [candidate division WS6 bacterium 34_10]
MKLKTSKNFTAILTSVLATFAIYTGALLIFLYVQGWRIDLLDQSIKQVGVLTVDSSPSQANIYVNDQHKGRTAKSTTLDVGTYDVRVSREGYYDWNKKIKIVEEKSTPVSAYLIRTEFEEETVSQSDLTLDNYWVDQNNNHLLMLLNDGLSLRLLHHTINTGFWTLNSTPLTILEIDNDIEEPIIQLDLQLSPSGEKAILQIITETTDSKYVIPTTRISQYEEIITTPLPLAEFSNYTLSWAKDENFLLLESDTDVISYNLERNTKHLLYRKVDDLDIWSTDEDGYFYIFRNNTSEDENVLTYSLEQYNLDGSGKTIIIPNVYFQSNKEFINSYRGSDFQFSYFTNSPENTQTIGEITDFIVKQDLTGIYIKTTDATYWYNSTTGKYITVSPYPADVIQFSPDGDKVLINSQGNYKVFILDKEEGDHTVTIGTHPINNLNSDLVKRIHWLSNSRYFQFEEDNFIYISDIDGDNKTPLMESEGITYWTVTSSRENLITLTESEDTGVVITSYTIH